MKSKFCRRSVGRADLLWQAARFTIEWLLFQKIVCVLTYAGKFARPTLLLSYDVRRHRAAVVAAVSLIVRSCSRAFRKAGYLPRKMAVWRVYERLYIRVVECCVGTLYP